MPPATAPTWNGCRLFRPELIAHNHRCSARTAPRSPPKFSLQVCCVVRSTCERTSSPAWEVLPQEDCLSPHFHSPAQFPGERSFTRTHLAAVSASPACTSPAVHHERPTSKASRKPLFPPLRKQGLVGAQGLPARSIVRRVCERYANGLMAVPNHQRATRPAMATTMKIQELASGRRAHRRPPSMA